MHDSKAPIPRAPNHSSKPSSSTLQILRLATITSAVLLIILGANRLYPQVRESHVPIISPSYRPRLEISPLTHDLATLRLTDHDLLYIPSEPFLIKCYASGAIKTEQTVTISSTEPAPTCALPRSATGKVHVSVSDIQEPQRFLPLDTDLEISPPKVFSGSLNIKLIINPGNVLLVKQSATLVAELTAEDHQTPVEAPKRLRISFLGAGGKLDRKYIEIPPHETYGTAILTSDTPQKIQLIPIVQPLSISGKQIHAEFQNVEFLPPIAQLRVSAAQPYLVSSFFTPSTEITATFLDSDQKPVKADAIREILLTVDPPQAGRVGRSRLIIEPNKDSATTTYTPMQDGKAKIRASAGMPVIEPEIAFEYPWWGGPLLLLALVGGLIGALLKGLEQTQLQQKQVTASDFFKKFLLSGFLGAILAFFFGATFLRTDFQRALLESASSPLVSVYWGIFGGYLGPLFIVRSLIPKEDAVPKTAGSNDETRIKEASA